MRQIEQSLLAKAVHFTQNKLLEADFLLMLLIFSSSSSEAGFLFFPDVSKQSVSQC